MDDEAGKVAETKDAAEEVMMSSSAWLLFIVKRSV